MIIDTGSNETYIAVTDGDDNIFVHENHNLRYSQSEKLLSVVDHMFTKHNIAEEKLEAIMVNPGPGSYTGIRVGLTTANLLAFSLNIPVCPIATAVSDKTFVAPLSAKYLHKPIITKEKPRLG